MPNNDKHKDPDSPPKHIIIKGVTENGKEFRPNDWAERMSGKLSTLHNQRLRYSPLLQPAIQDGHKCVLLDPRLKESNPELYRSILDFAREHKLKICKE
jgi:hypothetical protein